MRDACTETLIVHLRMDRLLLPSHTRTHIIITTTRSAHTTR
jgi:hypothetical protein